MTRHAHHPYPPYRWQDLAGDVVRAVLVLVVLIALTAVAVGVEP